MSVLALLVTLLAVVIVVGLILWGVSFIPMEPVPRRFLQFVVVAITAIALLYLLARHIPGIT